MNHPPETVAAVVQAWNAGTKVADIASATGVPTSSIYGIARHHGGRRRMTSRRGAGAAGSEFAEELALTGGHWVPGRHGIQRWVAA